MITVTGTLTCANAEEADLVRTYLPEHIRLSRAEPGGLNAMCPSPAPDASRNRSTPPARAPASTSSAGSSEARSV